MKRILLLAAGLLVCGPFCASGQGSGTDPAAVALQRDTDERLKRIEAELRNVAETQELVQRRQDELRQRFDRLEGDIRGLKEDQSRSSGNYASRDELRKCFEKLKEVDEKRESDKKLILENIRELKALPAAPPAETAKPPARRQPESPDEMPFVYTVKKSDRLLDIVALYNTHFQKTGKGKITVDDVLKANPGLKADRLIPGKKIQIPMPAKDDK